MKKLLLAGLIGSLLVGCGGGDDKSSDGGVNIIIPLPTEPCLDGSCLEDDGFTNPNLPVTPPTTPCEEGMDCMDDGFTNPNLPLTPIEPPLPPSVEDQISKLLNWDKTEITELCNSADVECSIGDEGEPLFTVSTYNGVTVYSPLDATAKGMGYRKDRYFADSTMSLNSFSSAARDTCQIFSTDNKNIFVTYGDYKISLQELESEAAGSYKLGWACFYEETSNVTGAYETHTWTFAKPRDTKMFQIMFETAMNK